MHENTKKFLISELKGNKYTKELKGNKYTKQIHKQIQHRIFTANLNGIQN